jgi:Flp pilus assembly protein TadD
MPRFIIPLAAALLAPILAGAQAAGVGVGETKSGETRRKPGGEPALEVEQALYQMLISEIASQRGRVGLAVRGMTDLAKRSGDARLARRAVEMGFQARDLESILDASLLWLKLQPDSAMARQALAAALDARGGLAAVKAGLAKALAVPERAPGLFVHVNGLLAHFGDKAGVLAVVRELAAAHAQLPEAQMAIAQAELGAGNLPAAEAAAGRAMKMRKDWDFGAVQMSRVLRARSIDDAARYLDKFVADHPRATESRLQYARLLFSQNALLSAREQFRALARLEPDEPEHAHATALISQQIEDFDDAEREFKRALGLKPKEPDAIHFNLGQIAEVRKMPAAALDWYRRVGAGEYFVGAQLKIAGIKARAEGLPAGRRHLADLRAAEKENAALRVQLILAEAQLLRDAKQLADAHALLTEHIDVQPDAADLLYDRAMVAEKLGKLESMELDLRRVIELKPDHAHAFNALGYTFAERNVRLEEAFDLIKRAVELAPDDAYIQDSLGWVQFRLGRVDEALTTLRGAYEKRRDPEIAAHLAEVLLAKGLREEAVQIARTALLEHPDHESLLAALKKAAP